MTKKRMYQCLISCIVLLIGMLLVSFLLLQLLSAMVWKMDGNLKLAGGGIIAIYAVVSLVGGFFTGRIFGKHKFFWGLLIGLWYFGVILLTGILFAGTEVSGNSGIFPGVMICSIAGMLGGMLAPVHPGAK